MFDGIGFMELLLIGVLGLIVLGPERLPVAVRSVTSWVRAMKRMANSVKEELEQELKIEQLHADLKKAESKGLSNLSPELQESIEQLKQAAQSVNRPYQVQDTPSAQDNQIHNPASQTVSTEASSTSASSAPKSESIQGEDPRSNTKANG
ncbi:Sec-independent protein translocase subunit TatB [Shewanella oneidensis MR-1]|uniref:Sec-independent protein translocase protein TatB n=1 Tax=Shewanella oneidensis (strain ATCC 700550 / JCM 31522 / CIP 106686 / LMG 19005 / NCIMB 14063 / MR-1) TaxID=211586 RepID=TATB_SHEON|nr:Sec-independent protein translocase protein TatB [Shewanella oneidensis]Q8E9R3.1 RecName: Full=Sec-independent protein translocase protein TatB [Shewanella oneidensis MR-1]AAN57175.1 twin arginine protein translocase system protein TatB [Shewanella oneidensis MR-1]MDX5998507.1 Sec-independent protein translocase protein TatB [Shewanella oneidensis]MEE2029693.1 Sec-independent protein translocase protein TatB [Shewanella oneidensis]QKG98436.1 Sec-independent protein translocase subunit TatB 